MIPTFGTWGCERGWTAGELSGRCGFRRLSSGAGAGRGRSCGPRGGGPFLRRYEGEPGIQRTYAYLLVDHLRWLDRETLRAARSNNRFLDHRLSILEAELIEAQTQSGSLRPA
jgi:hypothetical protein